MLDVVDWFALVYTISLGSWGVWDWHWVLGTSNRIAKELSHPPSALANVSAHGWASNEVILWTTRNGETF